MVEFLTSLPFIDLFINFMIASTALMGAVWCLEKLRVINTPDLAELAWKLAIAASFIAILPASLNKATITIENDQATSFVSKLNDTITEPRRMHQGITPSPTVHPPVGDQAVQPSPLQPLASDSVTPASRADEGKKAEAFPSSLSENIRTIDMIALLWASFASLALITLAISYLRAIKGLGTRVRVNSEHPANQTLRRICEKAAIRHVPYLSRSGDIKSPICLPRREICLPDWAFETMAEDDLESLLAHEVGHMVRHDPIMLIVLQFLARLFFFQPMFVLAQRRLTDIAELAADEWAAKQLSNSKAVASALYACANKIHQQRQTTWGMAMAGRESILKARVERLLKADGSAFKASGASAKLLLSALLVALAIGLPGIQFSHATDKTYPHAGKDREITVEGETAAPVAPPAVPVAQMGQKPKDTHPPEGTSLNFSSSHDEYSIQLLSTGHFALNDTEDAFLALSETGDLKLIIDTGEKDASYHMIVKDGQADHAFYKNGEAATNQQANEAWLREAIHNLITEGYDTEERVSRILKAGTPSDVLEETARMKTDWVKHSYLLALLDRTTLTDKEQRKLTHMVLDFKDDFHKKLVLLRLFDKDTTDNRVGLALKAAKDMKSDFERRELVTVALQHEGLTRKNAAAFLKVAKTINSDFELRSLLAAAVLNADIDLKTAEKLIDLAEDKIDSDFEKRAFYTHMVQTFGHNEDIMSALLDATDKLDSDFEKRQMLDVMISHASLSETQWLDVIDIAEDMDGGFEKKSVLMHIKQFAPESSKIEEALAEAGYSGDMETGGHAFGFDADAFEEQMEHLGEELERQLEAVEHQLEELDETLNSDKTQAELEAARKTIQREIEHLQENGIREGLMAAQEAIDQQIENLDPTRKGSTGAAIRHALEEAKKALAEELENLGHHKKNRGSEMEPEQNTPEKTD